MTIAHQTIDAIMQLFAADRIDEAFNLMIEIGIAEIATDDEGNEGIKLTPEGQQLFTAAISRHMTGGRVQ